MSDILAERKSIASPLVEKLGLPDKETAAGYDSRRPMSSASDDGVVPGAGWPETKER